MPLYEFSCGDCGAQFEAIQSFSATTTPACPVCKSVNVARLLSAPAIHFKGSGWYITDSKKSGKQSANGASRNNGEGAGEANGASATDKNESSSESSAATAASGDASASSGASAASGKAQGDAGAAASSAATPKTVSA